MVIVTHEMGFARVATRVLFMDDGQILEENTPDQFSLIRRIRGQRSFCPRSFDVRDAGTDQHPAEQHEIKEALRENLKAFYALAVIAVPKAGITL